MIASASAYRAPEFETLMARFFDGVLTEAEDRAFSELLAASPERAKRFLEQVRMERALGGAMNQRIESDAFVTAVMRGVKLAQDGSDTERFARIVAKQARGVSQRRMASRRSRVSLRGRRTEPAPGVALWLPVLGAAALVSLVVLLGGSSGSGRPGTSAAATSKPAEPADQYRPSDFARAAPAAESESATPGKFEPLPEQPHPEFEPDALAQADPAPAEPFEPEPVEPGGESPRPAPAELPNALGAKPAREAERVLAHVVRVAGVSAKLRSADGERDLVERQALSTGNTLVLKSEGGAATAAEQAGAELALENGTSIWLDPNSALRFDAHGVAVLEAGSLAFRVAGPAQAEGWKLQIDSGPQVAAKSAAARVRRDATNRRVVVLVDEGRAEISNLGAKEVVVANHGCVSPFQSTPGSPYLFQTLKGSGIVTQPPPSATDSGSGARESSTGEAAGAVPAPNGSGTDSDGSGTGAGPSPGKPSGSSTGTGKTGGSGNANPPGASGGTGNGGGSGASKTGGSGNGTPPGAGGGSGTGAGSGNGTGRGPSGGTPPGAGSGRTGAGSGTGGTGRGSGAGGGAPAGTGRGSGSPPPKSGGPKAGKGSGVK